jgi:gamma-glutamyl hydrolase
MLSKIFQSVAIILILSNICCATVPVVGILSQPKKSGNETSIHYIAASYVKWVESSGATSIPIPYDADEALTREIFSQINGVLFPGGSALLPLSAKVMWDLALKSNNSGDYFPVWGTCLGFEFLIELTGGIDALQTGFNAENVSLPLILSSEQNSQLYEEESIKNIVTTKHITMNNHRNGITPSHFEANKSLTAVFRITSTNVDLDGTPFVSTIESSMAFGVQYHPEKNNFEYGLQPGTSIPYEAISHTEDAIKLSFHLASFFGSCLRKSSIGKYTLVHRHRTIIEYPVVKGIHFEQEYIIPPAKEWEMSEKLEDSYETARLSLRGSTLSH